MFEYIYFSEIFSLANRIINDLDNLDEWRKKTLAKPNLIASNIDDHNGVAQRIVTQSALLADLIKSTPKTKPAKEAYKLRRKFLRDQGALDNSKLRVILKPELRDSIVHFAERIDDIQFTSVPDIKYLAKLYSITLGDHFEMLEDQPDKRFLLYKCERFKNGSVMALKLYNYSDNTYYNLNAKISFYDLRHDIELILNKMKSIPNLTRE